MNWNLGRLSKVSNGLLAVALGLVLASAASASPRGTEQVAAGLAVENQNVRWEKFLIKGEPQPTFRFAVGHQHATGACFGYLYISRDEIWYEVKAPVADHDHEFRYPLATLTEARQWTFLGITKPDAELKFSQGKTYHFFRIPESLLEDLDLEHHKLKADDMLSWEPIVQAAENFDETVRLAEHGQAAPAEQGQAAPAPQPVPTVTQKLDPSTVDKVTQPPPAAPPTIVLVEPSVEKSGQTLEVSSSAFTIRGVAMDISGIPAVTINGTPVAIRPKSAQAAEFSSAPIVLHPGENRFEVSAINASHAEAKIVFIARYTPPPPSERPQQTIQPNSKPLTKVDILNLLKDGAPSARIAAAVRENGIRFIPAEVDLKQIRAAGGGDDLVDALKKAAPPLKP